MRPARTTLAYAVGAALAMAALTGGAARADSASPVVLPSYHQMVVDDRAGYVFISEGAGNTTLMSSGAPAASAIVVTDLGGGPVATLEANGGVEGIAVSSDGKTLYAALGASDSVAVIDVSTITSATPTEVDYPLGSGEVPYSVAYQSGRIWVSYDDGTAGQSGIGDINLSPASGSPAFEADANLGTWYDAPDLAADPSDGGTLVANESDNSWVATFNVATSPVTVLVARTSLGSGCNNATAPVVLPGGAQFLIACPASIEVLNTADLTFHSVYAMIYEFTNSVAVADSTGLVAGGNFGDTHTLSVFHQGSETAANVFNLPLILPYGLGLTSDGSTLYAVTRNYGSTSITLHVIISPDMIRSSLTLKASTTRTISDVSLSLSGMLTPGVPYGSMVVITRTGPDGSTVLPAVQVASDGSYSTTDDLIAPGAYTYTASYAGTSLIQPATATLAETVAKAPSALTLRAPKTVTFGAPAYLSGRLVLVSGPPPAGTPVTVTRSGGGAPAKKFAIVTTDASGDFAVTDPGLAKGTYSYAAAYAGNALNTAAATALTLTVARTMPSLTINTTAGAYQSGTRINVTVRLGSTLALRTVSLYATPVGQPRVLLKTGPVSANGTLTVSYPLARTTTFTVTYAGDVHNAPNTSTRVIGARVKIVMAATGYFSTRQIGAFNFHVFHADAKLNAKVAVSPNKHGQCLKFEVQQYIQGAGGNYLWFPTQTFGCYTLSKASQRTANFTLNKAVGAELRIRPDYVRSARDTTNLSTSGNWFYFMVVS